MRSQDLTKRDRALTEINGTVINETVTWTLEDSPIMVSGTLDIVSNGTLIVNPGATLVFKTHSSGIMVNTGGQLLINGNSTHRVTLKSNHDQGRWNGIEFKAGHVEPVFDADMNYVNGSAVQYADILHTVYFHSWHSAPYLSNVDIIDHHSIDSSSSNDKVIQVEDLQVTAVMRNLRVLRSDQNNTTKPYYGILVTGKNDGAGIFIAENITIEAENYSLYTAGIYHAKVVQSFFKGLGRFYRMTSAEASDNTFADSLEFEGLKSVAVSRNFIQNGIVVENIQSVNANPSFFLNNFITNSRFYFLASYQDYANVTISGNTIEGSNNGGMFIRGDRLSSINVVNNTMERCSSANSIVEVFSYVASKFSFTNNTISNSIGYRVLRTMFYPDDYDSYARFFSDNLFFNNSGTGSLVLFDMNPVSFTRNVFDDNNRAPISVEMSAYNFIGPTIELPLNFWGAFQDDIVSSRATVIDGYTVIGQPVLDFNPVLSGPSIER